MFNNILLALVILLFLGAMYAFLRYYARPLLLGKSTDDLNKPNNKSDKAAD